MQRPLVFFLRKLTLVSWLVLLLAVFHIFLLNSNNQASAATAKKTPVGLGKKGRQTVINAKVGKAINDKDNITYSGSVGGVKKTVKVPTTKKGMFNFALKRTASSATGGLVHDRKSLDRTVETGAMFAGKATIILDPLVNPDSVAAGTLSPAAKKRIAENNAKWRQQKAAAAKADKAANKKSGSTGKRQNTAAKVRKSGVVLNSNLATKGYSNAVMTDTPNPRSVSPEYAAVIPENGNIQIITYVDKERIDKKGNRDARIGNVTVKIERIDGEDPDCSNRNKKSGKTNGMRLTPKSKKFVKGTINWRGCATGKYKATLVGREGYDNVGQTEKEFYLSDDETQIVKFVVKQKGDPETIIVE